ncbi:MAG: serine hydrolase [Firmicutes bacterium]|nr:serine hydrolase [Bacillota bacterium]
MKTSSIVLIALFFILLAVPMVYANENTDEGYNSRLPEEIGLFTDPFFEKTMADHHIPGAVFVAVENGRVIYAQGYGYADLDKKTPVDPKKTMFCAGSVGKLFNWTALMQLYEAGKFDLHDDINLYLHDLHIPETFPGPVTFHHLLTHTPGFDDRNTAATPDSIEQLLPLNEYLAWTLPTRLRPPGQVTQYSNHGAVLSGLLIENISGVPFDQYVTQNIFKPLQMNYSTFSQPQPEKLQPYLATGYHYINEIHIAQPVRIANVMPAGMGYFSGLDMANFLIAHLQLGEFKDNRILAEDTSTLMHQTHFQNDPRLPGMAYGFIENYKNNRRLLWHTGTSPDFHSLLVMMPEENSGFFFSMNMVDQRVSRKLLQEFMDYFYPAELEEIAPTPQDIEDAALYNGVYRTNWHAHRTLEKLAVLGRDVLVKANADGSLSISFENSPATRWIRTDENLFRNDSLDEYVSFSIDQSGYAYRLNQGSRPMLAYEKIACWETTTLHIILQVAVIAIFISNLLAAIVGRFMRKKAENVKQDPGQARFARLTGNLVSLIHPLFIIGFLAIQMKVVSGSFDLLFYAVLTLPIILAVLSLIITIFAILAWKKSYWGLGGRIHYTLLVIAALANSWFLYYWNLIGYKV